jgi:hypothetical protein
MQTRNDNPHELDPERLHGHLASRRMLGQLFIQDDPAKLEKFDACMT